MKTTRTIIVGGFLGAGKTTLLFEATKQLMNKGLKVGLITNDQAPELVDTAILLQTHVQVAEVSGSCFCCNFNGFIDSLKQVKQDAQADIIIAEPVGSCTDLSATIMQPLKELMSSELIVAPLTVLADPIRLSDILDGGTAGLHPSAAYIFSKQLEESDIILITKTDLLQPHEVEQLKEKVKLHYPQSEVLTVSSKTGVGMEEWLQKVLTSTVSGQHIVEVDYEKYAEGEAVLGWLNGTISLQGKEVNWDSFAKNFLTLLGEKVDRLGLGVGHIKIMLESGTSYLAGNLTGNLSTLSIRGKVGVSDHAQLIINARVGISPDLLENMVKETLDSIAGNSITQTVKAWKCLSPGYPNPTHRYSQVV
jgi:Ni2+-binding GTPase involved in maturation of urease and hydrogenase